MIFVEIELSIVEWFSRMERLFSDSETKVSWERSVVRSRIFFSWSVGFHWGLRDVLTCQKYFTILTKIFQDNRHQFLLILRNVSGKLDSMKKWRVKKISENWKNFVLVTCQWKECTRIHRSVGSLIFSLMFSKSKYSVVFFDFDSNPSRTWYFTFSTSLITDSVHDILDYSDNALKNAVTHDWHPSERMNFWVDSKTPQCS